MSDTMMAVTPVAFHHRIEGYTEAEGIEVRQERRAGANWYGIWYTKALHIAASILLVIIYFKGKEVWVKRKEMNRLFSFLLFFGGFTSLCSLVPVLLRFLILGNLFSIAFLFLYFCYNKTDGFTEMAFKLLLPAFGLFMIVAIREGFDSTSIYAFITNPIIAPSININEIALIDLIKGR